MPPRTNLPHRSESRVEPRDLLPLPAGPRIVGVEWHYRLLITTFRPYDWVQEGPLRYRVYARGHGRARGTLDVRRGQNRETTRETEWDFRWDGKIGVQILSGRRAQIIAFEILSGGSRPNRISEVRGEPVVIQDEFVLMPLLIPLGRNLIGRHIRTIIPSWPHVRLRGQLEEGYRPEELLPPD